MKEVFHVAVDIMWIACAWFCACLVRKKYKENQILRIANDQLAEGLKRAERERNAAVEDIKAAAFSGCHVCKHYYRPDPNVRVYSCRKFGDFDSHEFIADDGSIYCGAMEWRGVQGAEDGKESKETADQA